MKITIVIPVYNVEPYIEACLASVAAQTYIYDLECIIVNDCTPDGSCAIIERFIKEYNGGINFKLLHHTQNRGLSVARNTGIDAATGDYIYFLDSDDEITPECLELLTTPLNQKKYDFVIGDYKTTGIENDFPPLRLEQGEVTTNLKIRNLYFSAHWYVMAVNKLCNLEFIRKEKLYFKERLINEDELWSFQLSCTAKSMFVVKKETYIYKFRETSIMGKQNKANRAISLSTIMKETYRWAKEKGIAYNKKTFKKILSYREIIFSTIFSQKTYKDRIRLYLSCYKGLRISPWQAYNNKAINTTSLVKELYNYMPGVLGYWYIRMYYRILRK